METPTLLQGPLSLAVLNLSPGTSMTGQGGSELCFLARPYLSDALRAR